MELTLDDLVCPDCRSYVHPFLELCPGCGAERASRYSGALRDGPEDPSIADDPKLQRAMMEAATSHALLAHRSGAIGAGGAGAASTSLEERVDILASSITYRAVGLPGAREAADVTLHAGDNGLRVGDERGNVLLVVDAALLLAATPAPRGARGLTRWSGLRFEEFIELRTPANDGDGLLLTYRSPSGHQQIAVGNRRGIFASKARADHYENLARLIAALAGVRAEVRWREVGADAYAVALGLRVAPRAVGSKDADATLQRPDGSMPPDAVGRFTAERSARERLEELEGLRAAHLVTDLEYERKRREILDRL